jgi:hypothetical protein
MATEKVNLPQIAEPTAHENLPPHYKSGRASDIGLDQEPSMEPAHRAAEARDPVTLSDVETPAHGAEAAQEEWIRQRAYQLWEEEGRPGGRALDHWLKAKDELTGHGYEWHSPSPLREKAK